MSVLVEAYSQARIHLTKMSNIRAVDVARANGDGAGVGFVET
jgi:hypothetical protein